MELIKRILYVFVQCTWGVVQSFVGFIVFLINIKKLHYSYRGAIVTEWWSPSSVSLGLFLFVCGNGENRKKGEKSKRMADSELVMHEYGHTIQSLILGPAYLLMIGIPSLLWANLPFYVKKRDRGVPYSAFWTEKSADELGRRTAGKKQNTAVNTEK